MTPPRRRSARLRAVSVSPQKNHHLTPLKLPSVLERDETIAFGVQSNLDAMVSSPIAPTHKIPTEPTTESETYNVRTPNTAGRIYPSMEEMHPSKVQQSTTKQPDSGLRLGFVDVAAYAEPSRFRNSIGITQETPTKPSRVFSPQPPSSPGFEFKFTRPGPALGPEAQKMMDDLREEALRIKAKLAAEHDEERARQEFHEQRLSVDPGRKIIKAKGKAGRFSDVHMNEFKKMDSIAGHPSAYRAQPPKIQATGTSLKRSKSQAKLDEPDPSAASCVHSAKKPREHNPEKNPSAKRLKTQAHEDISFARPVSRDGATGAKPPTPGLTRSRSGLPTAVTTPTKASLARSASVKHMKTGLSSISRSLSTRTMAGAKSENSNKHLVSLGNLSRMKSILRRPRIFSDDNNSATAESITSPTPTLEPTAAATSNVNKALPSLPSPCVKHERHSTSVSPVKRVNFAADTNIPAAPSLIKKLAQQSPSKSTSAPIITYPSLPQPFNPAPVQAHPSPSRNFTFSSDRTISFGPAVPSTTTTTITGPAPTNDQNNNNTRPTLPAGTSTATNPRTIRQVRPSLLPSSSSLSTLTTTAAAHSPLPLPSVPHGIANKKRHLDAAADSDEENREPATKKQHLMSMGEMGLKNVEGFRDGLSGEGDVVVVVGGGGGGVRSSSAASPLKKTPRAIPGPKDTKRRRGVLSASRLNVLARPRR